MVARAARATATEGPVAFFLLGAVSLLAQTVLVREALFAFHGGEIGLGLFFALWLAGIALGAAGGTSLVQARAPTPARASEWFRLGLSLLTWVALLQLLLWRLHRALLPVDAGGYLPAPSYLLLLLLAALPVALLTGLLFPAGLQAWPIAPGRAYALESLGSMVGGAAAVLVALPRLSHLTVAALGAPAVLLWLIHPRVGQGARASGLALAGAATLGLVLGVWDALDQLTARQRWELLDTGTRPVVQLETPYHQVTVGALGSEMSLYLDGLYEGALEDPYGDSLTAAVVLTQHPAPRRVLLMAPGLYGAGPIMAQARHVSLELVRADAGIDRAIALAHEHANVTGASVVTADARAAVRALSVAPDLIALLHGGATTGAANRLYTREFFATCARALDEAGVLVVALPGAANVEVAEGLALRNATYAALRESFAEVRRAPGTTSYFFAAQPGGAAGAPPLSWEADSLAARRARLWPSARPWPPGIFAALFPPDRVEASARHLAHASARGIAPNSDRRPTAYYHQLRRWDRLSGSGLCHILDRWHSAPWPWSLGLVGVLAAVGWGVRRRWGQAAVSMASTGTAGMGVSLLLLLVYQSCLGTLYLEVGLLSAVFMAGLGLGALAAAHWVKRCAKPAPMSLLAASDSIWVLALVGLVPLTAAVPSWGPPWQHAGLLGLAALAGLLTGAAFPLVAAALRARGAPGAVAGGIADAADHAGAVFGALLTGTLLVPLLGFSATLGLLAALKALSLAGSLLALRT